MSTERDGGGAPALRPEAFNPHPSAPTGRVVRAKGRVRVLFIIGTLELGGAERQLAHLALGLDRTQFDPSVCCIFTAGPLASVLESGGVPVVNLSLQGSRLRRRPWTIPAQALRLLAAMRAIRPDVVHGYLYWAYVAGALAGRWARVPVVLAGRRSLGHFKEGNTMLLTIERLANRFTDVIVANSQAVRSDVLRQERVASEKVAVIYNGIEVSPFRVGPQPWLRRELGIAPDQPVVSIVANLIRYKGHPDFLEAWKRVLQAQPRAVALLVGEGPMRGELEASARRLGIEETIRFLGRRMDVPELLSITDVVVQPSLEEGFCNAILEAMAAGKPVVATAVGGNPEAVADGETGVLVPPKDPESLAQGILALMKEPERARKMGLAGRARVEREFGLQAMVERYEQVYLDLLAQKKVRLDPR